MFVVRPVRELVNLPVPLLSDVQFPPMAGLSEVFQQTPLLVTLDPPSEMTLPPAVAEVVVIDLMGIVVITVGVVAAASVAKATSLPYDVPFELVAYALA